MSGRHSLLVESAETLFPSAYGKLNFPRVSLDALNVNGHTRNAQDDVGRAVRLALGYAAEAPGVGVGTVQRLLADNKLDVAVAWVPPEMQGRHAMQYSAAAALIELSIRGNKASISGSLQGEGTSGIQFRSLPTESGEIWVPAGAHVEGLPTALVSSIDIDPAAREMGAATALRAAAYLGEVANQVIARQTDHEQQPLGVQVRLDGAVHG